ncbi:MAG: DEAD/DEAH box helicase family protein [Actinomycetota bacterium]
MVSRKTASPRSPIPSSFWPHQRAAIETAEGYLSDAQRGNTACLITMPTGTGKTGVIAGIVGLLPGIRGHRLVLTPWDALVRQLIDDLSSRFWKRIPDLDPPDLSVRRFPSSTDISAMESAPDGTVFVATIAAISVLERRSESLGIDMTELFSAFGVILVDEGHYEPAQRWSRAIRLMERPTVLLTATPYRNDRKFFNVGGWRYRFSHHDAENQAFLRKPAFHEIPPDARNFATAVLDEIGKHPEGTRAIVRCKDREAIRSMVSEFQRRGEPVIGIHETFAPGDAALLRDVPPTTHDARLWVHQFKLIEGIDDPRFRVLAFHHNLGNDRAVVQQIGRVLRNPDRKKSRRKASVLSTNTAVEATWEAYRVFDAQDDPESVATVPELVERILDAQPAAFYVDGGYRVHLDLAGPDAWDSFAFPLRTRIYRRDEGVFSNLSAVAREVVEEWEERDRTVFPLQRPDDSTVIIPFVTAENSPLLRSSTFIEPRFGYTLIRFTGPLAFVLDTRGQTPSAISISHRQLNPEEIQTLLPEGTSNLTSISLLNTDIGQFAARSRSTRASSIESVAPELGDYAYICSTAEGTTDDGLGTFRRYLGISNSRIVDHKSGETHYQRFSAWLDTLASLLSQPNPALGTFDRYAQRAAPPDDVAAEHILIDADPVAFVRENDASPHLLNLQDVAQTIQDGSFVLNVNGDRHSVDIAWDQMHGRYSLESKTLREARYIEVSGDKREFIAALNEDQAFRIIPVGRTVIYSRGNFYRPLLPARRASAFKLLDVLTPLTELSQARLEKGDIVGDDWQNGSLFGMVSALDPGIARQGPPELSSLLGSADLLICTDSGPEIADFIAIQGKRVVMIHAKASSETRKYSASALQVVSAQAIKSLPYLQPLNEAYPKTDYWTRAWKSDDGKSSTRRLRVGQDRSGRKLWEAIRSVVADPAAEREVWLLLGNCLSKSALKEQARPKGAPEAIQVYSLLQTTWGAVSQVGARLRIFCSN